MTMTATPMTSSAAPPGSGTPPPARRRPWGAVAFVVLLLIAGLVAYRATRPSHSGTALPIGRAIGGDTMQTVPVMTTDANRIGVTYALATTEAVSTEVRAVGQVTIDETRVAAISAKIDGWVDRLFVNVTGQVVQRDAPLLTIYSPMLVSAQEELLLAKRLDSGIAHGTPDAIAGTADLVTSARRRLSYWDIPQADVERLEATGEVTKTMTLRSPVSGVVLDKGVVAGQSVMAGQTLYRVADLTTVWVQGEVYEQDLPAVRLGAIVTAEFQGLPGQQRRGRIGYVYPTVDPDSRTVRVRVELPNADLALKPGMYATVHFTSPVVAGVVSVPRSAVLSTGARSLVFVRRADGRLEPHVVTLGVANDDRIQILHGVEPGQMVVASATFLVDAESNLGAALGGMGNMPGMDITKPVDTRDTGQARGPVGPAAPRR